MDGTVRTWDLPTGRLLSWFAVEDAVTSLSMSPNGDFLATTHVGSLGIFLWANRSLYGAVSLKPIDADVDVADVLALPASAQSIAGATDADAILQGDDDDDDDDDDSSEGSEESEEDEAASKDFAPLGSDLVTFSTLPASRWANLSNLTEIRQRNKPKEAPKAPKAAPFFLPINQGLQSSFALPDRADDAMDSSDLSSKVLNFGKLGVLSKFQRTLLKCAQADDFDELLDMLKAMGISAINLEIRSLSLDPEAGQLKQFLDFLIAQLKLRQNFELVQSYMHLFLKVHGDVIATSPALIDSLQEAVASQELSWVHIEGLFQHSLCVLGFLRGGGM